MLDSIQLAFARYRLRYPVYLFHHIPKCGGTSVRKVLDDWFHVYDDYYEGDHKDSISPVDLKYLNSEKCLCGHFGHDGYMIDQRYPAVFGSFRARSRYRVFSFLRDPLEMRCSLFRHQRQEKANIEESLAQNIMTYDNYYARIIGLSDEDYQRKLDRYFFIGIQEQMQSSFDVLAQLLNKPKVSLPTVNQSSKFKDGCSDVLSAKEIASFKKANQLDYKVYDYAQNRLTQLMSGNHV